VPKVKVIHSGLEREVMVPAGGSILDAAVAAGVPVEGTCGGKGTCGKCRVRLISGRAVDPTPAETRQIPPEKLSAGWVLACQRPVADGLAIRVETAVESGPGKESLEGVAAVVAAEPVVEKHFLRLAAPTVDDQQPDLERLLSGLPLDGVLAGPGVLANLPRTLRESGFEVTAVLAGRRLLAVEPGDTTGRSFGLALDLGTTTLAGYLVDLGTGKTLAASSLSNPQRSLGADVISRINHVSENPGGLRQLQEMVLEALNRLIEDLLSGGAVAAEEVYEAVVVGNTTMAHLFLGIDPSYLAPAPFIPAFRRPLEVTAGELGLAMHPGARVLMLPNIAGYVGSDTVGVMTATGLDRNQGWRLAVDIGTNGEVVLAGGGRILTCSTAAGPAFEGAHIRHGMRAARGAIESVKMDQEVTLGTIGGAAPAGICGSGLIDAVAGMLRAGVINPSGRLADPATGAAHLPPGLRDRLRKTEGGSEFILASGSQSAAGEDIAITQKDLRELQLAKGAILAGIRILLGEAGITAGEISEVYLAGAFGNFISRASAVAIGLLPDIPLERIIPVGNAAGDGARLALISRTERERALSLADRAEHVELSARRDFQDLFVQALYFPG